MTYVTITSQTVYIVYGWTKIEFCVKHVLPLALPGPALGLCLALSLGLHGALVVSLAEVEPAEARQEAVTLSVAAVGRSAGQCQRLAVVFAIF